ncbi:MAG: ABC transporter permease, partial [Planctomycetes bacterium]|nr:ABC transporter permease [Planctomycetota bacterium]
MGEGGVLRELALAPVRLGRDLWRCRELLLNLAGKEVRVRYKQSLLGIAWAVFVPVSMMLVFTFVFGRLAPVKLDGVSASGQPIPYAVFAYCGLLPWTFFAQSLSGSV